MADTGQNSQAEEQQRRHAINLELTPWEYDALTQTTGRQHAAALDPLRQRPSFGQKQASPRKCSIISSEAKERATNTAP
jgi:hypothetical protein